MENEEYEKLRERAEKLQAEITAAENYTDEQIPEEHQIQQMPIEEEVKNAPQTVYGDSSVGIIKELSPEKTLLKLQNNLQGKFWNKEKKAFIKIHDPELNDYGVQQILSIVTASLNDVATFSNIPTKEEANALILHTCNECLPFLFAYHQEWGVKNKGQLATLSNKIFSLVYHACHTCLGSGHRNVIRSAVSEQINDHPMPSQGLQQQPQQQGILSKINPFSKPQ